MTLMFRSLLTVVLGISSVAGTSYSSEDIIVLDASLTASFSFWIGGSVTLSQCNSQCAEVNTGLFTTCGSYRGIFSKHMQCCCSATFAQKVKICSACCNQLGYSSFYSQLVQVDSACYELDKPGDKDRVIKTLSYVPVTYAATLPALTATQTIVLVSTAEPTTLPGVTATETIVIVTTPDSDEYESTTTTTTTSTSAAITSTTTTCATTTSMSTTSAVAKKTSTSTKEVTTPDPEPTTTNVIVMPPTSSTSTKSTATTTTKIALPTVTAGSGAAGLINDHLPGSNLASLTVLASMLAAMALL